MGERKVLNKYFPPVSAAAAPAAAARLLAAAAAARLLPQVSCLPLHPFAHPTKIPPAKPPTLPRPSPLQDFDPAKMPRMKKVRSEDKQMKVRMMLPMTVRCNVCGTFMYKGTKFNTRMEDVRGEDYLGIKIFRWVLPPRGCPDALPP